jgi:GTP-binding protein
VQRALRDVIVEASVGGDTALPDRSVPVGELEDEDDE